MLVTPNVTEGALKHGDAESDMPVYVLRAHLHR
jgi:hypothetical protein